MDDDYPLTRLDDFSVTRLDDIPIRILDDVQSSMSPNALVNRIFILDEEEEILNKKIIFSYDTHILICSLYIFLYQ